MSISKSTLYKIIKKTEGGKQQKYFIEKDDVCVRKKTIVAKKTLKFIKRMTIQELKQRNITQFKPRA